MKVYDLKAKAIADIELNPEIFEIEPNQKLIHELVVAELAGARQGGASVKGRSEVRGGGRKPRRQKGTGMARQGTIRAPQWVGGGVVHGPHPRDFSKKMNKKARLAALKSVFTMKHRDGKIVVLDKYEMKEPSTKAVLSFVEKTNLNKPLFLTDDIYSDGVENFYYSARNIKDSSVIDLYDLAAYWIMKYDSLVMTKKAVEQLNEVLL